MSDDAAHDIPPIDLSQISSGRLSITPNFLHPRLLDAIRNDAMQLYAAGAFTTGEVGGTTDIVTNKSKRQCDVCGLFDDALKVDAGDVKGREDLFDLMSDLRDLLIDKLGRPLAETMELQYLRYPPQGFYGRHLDHYAVDDGNDIIRSVSLLIYLNDSTWDRKVDGGALRAYPRGQQPQTATPAGGTLVLFDSAATEHEVLATNRERWALVGWFMMEGAKNKGGREGKRRRQSKYSSSKGGKKGYKRKGGQSKHKRKF